MEWVGITGSMGSGKSTVSNMIEAEGFPVLRADEVSRLMSSPNSDGLVEIVKEFGPEVLNESGELSRSKLSHLVFGHKERLKKLESILHPKIRNYEKNWKRQQEKKGVDIAFYDIPLLFENQREGHFDFIICVVAEVEKIVERVERRSQLSREDVLKRLSHQLSVEDKMQKSDYVIENNGTLLELKDAVKSLLKNITNPKSSQS